MKETPTELKTIFKTLRDLSERLNLFLVKTNKTYLLPDVEIDQIIEGWNKFKKSNLMGYDDFKEVDIYCEKYIENKLQLHGDAFDYKTIQIYIKEVKSLVNDYKKREKENHSV
jgi:hypothetical protein|tara:strand:- start:4468 stop:4806 length:339 start_codon:yes stop_codon:yes gene_type:complete